MTTKENLEIRGRLLLWHSAISECQLLLKLAQRADLARTQSDIGARCDAHSAAFREFAESQPDYEKGIQKLSHRVRFDQQHPILFPSIVECLQIKTYCTMLAVVLFCQIFTEGHEDSGKVASNKRKFIEKHIQEIMTRVFPEEASIYKFYEIKEQMIKARNKMIGHADAEAFQITHGSPVTSMKLHVTALKDIELETWKEFLEPLRIGILEYIKKFGSSEKYVGSFRHG